MAVPSIQKQLESKFPYPHTEEDFNNLKMKCDLSLITEKAVKRSHINDVARGELEKAASAYNQFLAVVHSFNCDINENGFFLEFEGKTNYPPLRKANDTSCATEVTKYLSKFEQTNNCFVRDALFQIRAQLIDSYNLLASQLHIYDKGTAGEEYVETELDLIKNKYHFLRNIKIKYSDQKGETSETDLYIMTPKGLLVCEIKNWGSEKDVFYISKDGQWIKNPDGNYQEIINPSPFSQNTRHCVATEQLLHDNGICEMKIIPVVIIANEMVRIQNESANAIIRASELYNFIELLPLPEKYNTTYQSNIIKILEDNNDTEENYFTVKTWDEVNSQALLDYTKQLMEYMSDMYAFAENVSCNFRGQYPISKKIANVLRGWGSLLIIGGIIVKIILYLTSNPDVVQSMLQSMVLSVFGIIILLFIFGFCRLP